MTWQPIETAPSEEYEEFLVWDGVGIWKAWRCGGEIIGYECDGCEMPWKEFPPILWMPMPPEPQK